MMNIEGCVGFGQRARVEMPLVAKPFSNKRWWRESREREGQKLLPDSQVAGDPVSRPAGLEEV